MSPSHTRVLLGAALTFLALHQLKRVKRKRRHAIPRAASAILAALGILLYHGDRDYTWRVLVAAAIGLVVQRGLLRQKTRYITNLEKVGQRIGGTGADPAAHEYDFIIVGGGTAGCVLASRLSEDPNVRVLVLEAGASGRTLRFTRIPVSYGRLFRTQHDYNLYTEPQEHANGRVKYWPRGKMLGGCSSVNAQMAQYGAPSDFDEWAKITGDDSWSWSNFKRYFNKFENYQADSRYPRVDTSVKGNDGPVTIGYYSAISPKSKDFVEACTRLGVPFSPDFNTTKGTMGVNRVMTYVDEKCTRVSSETAYLTRDVLARLNLKVALHATVTKIQFKEVAGSLHAAGVEFTNQKDGARYQARALKEVILAGGAVHSPQILMLSGVGPQEELKKHGIEVVHDLPGVGSNLIDHPVVDVNVKDKFDRSNRHLQPNSLPDVIKSVGSLLKYIFFRSGALATNFGEAAAFIRSDDPALFPPEEYPMKLVDSTSSPDSPDLEIFTTALAYKEHGLIKFPMHTFAVHATLLRPMSKGTLRLRSSSPWDAPILDPRYLEAAVDVEKLVRGLKFVLRVIKAEPLSSHLDHNYDNSLLDHGLHTKSDDELRQIVRERVETLYHPASSCRMAPLAEGGVVDSQLKVYGIQGLRVCDASVFTTMVSGHTTGAVLAIAEKLADAVKAGRT
ncbi:hypothetical protein AX16_002687 [Volvariella volvacea WC 439]|nr:hypothetical protein AX16_002687 [Volvariella volvacea WC 439]